MREIGFHEYKLRDNREIYENSSQKIIKNWINDLHSKIIRDISVFTVTHSWFLLFIVVFSLRLTY